MRLLSVTVNNFGKHEKISLSFEPGVTVTYGPNEAGKSTVITAIAYNLFGSAMLGDTIDEYVTHGAKKSSLKTVTTFIANDGEVYEAQRGVSGAELRNSKGEVLVTNHAPVTAKIEELLGIPTGKAALTMLAAQNEVRGVLALGATAVMNYIEKLVDFSDIDRVVQRLKDSLVIGSTKPVEEQVLAKEQQLAELKAQKFETASETAISALKLQKLVADEEAVETKQVIYRLEAQQLELASAEQEWNSSLARVRHGLQLHDDLKAKIATGVEAQSAMMWHRNQADAQTQHSIWQLYSELISYNGDVWDGDLESLQAEKATTESLISSITIKIAGAQQEVTRLRKSKLQDTVCPYTKTVCNHLSDPEVIATTNAKIDSDIAALESQISTKYTELNEAKSTQIVINTVLAEQGKRNKALLGPEFSLRVALGPPNTVPRALTWIGGDLRTIEAPPPGTCNLATAETRIAEAQRAEDQLKVLPRLEDLEQELKKLQGACFRSSESLAEELTVTRQRLQNALAQAAAAEAEISRLEKIKAEAEQKEYHRLEMVGTLTTEIAELNKTIADIRENNDLMKAVAAARMTVADSLWSRVLSGTSAFFSQMRGKESIVALTPKGFTINGGRVVSGSTFDILGLALRVTTLKMFSNCGILILDEANAGADDRRSAAMTGFLAGAGFDQVLFSTHKAVDASGAHNLIEIGGQEHGM